VKHFAATKVGACKLLSSGVSEVVVGGGSAGLCFT
jgi:hypothetical protein